MCPLCLSWICVSSHIRLTATVECYCNQSRITSAIPELSLATALIPAKMEAVGGEANTLPATPPVSIPWPMYPAQKGSWPDPPPDIKLTFPWSIWNRRREKHHSPIFVLVKNVGPIFCPSKVLFAICSNW